MTWAAFSSLCQSKVCSQRRILVNGGIFNNSVVPGNFVNEIDKDAAVLTYPRKRNVNLDISYFGKMFMWILSDNLSTSVRFIILL